MISNELAEFIREQKAKGTSYESIKTMLFQNGWTQSDIDLADGTLASSMSQTISPKTKFISKSKGILLASLFILIFIGFMLFAMIIQFLQYSSYTDFYTIFIFLISWFSALGVILFKKPTIGYKIACVMVIASIFYFVIFMTPLAWLINPKVFA